MAENFTNLMKNIYKSRTSSSRGNNKGWASEHIIVKTLKEICKENILKAARHKQLCIREPQ